MIKNWIKNLSLVIMGITISLVIFELVLWAANISYPSFYESNFYTGASLRPGAEGWWRKEGEAYIRINSAGLRDREHTIEKPANTFRIAVLGDSFAEAMQVPQQHAFWAVLESELQQCPPFQNRNIEVINFGVSGYGTAQELMMFRHIASPYSPDMVILAFLTANDIRNNVRALEGDPIRPYFVYKNDHLELDASFRDSSGYRIRQHLLTKVLYKVMAYSRVLQLLNEGKNRLNAMLARTLQKAEGSKQGVHGEVGLGDMVFFAPGDQLWKEAWQVTEGLIVMMREEVEKSGANFMVVTLTGGIQVDPNPSRRKAYMDRLGVSNLFYPDSRIKSLGEREGIRVLNLVFPFLAYAEEHRVALHGFENTGLGGGHWNSYGHRLGGTLIAEEICSAFLPSEQLS